ncbi:MAG: GGDEF domain-containing protein [Halieaceae bacterium]|jgi:diguanylate cyclase (GGDEF)-like protein|nr:GGDEF domain-containing protein [Halieaceae bacterium]
MLLAIAVLDIDYFKRLNDSYGHPAGDEVLKCMVREITRVLRKGDILGRLGGEEFGILLHASDERALAGILERVRDRVEGLVTKHDEAELRLTVSIGASFRERGKPLCLESMLDAADEALYRAKNGGRNRVELALLD